MHISNEETHAHIHEHTHADGTTHSHEHFHTHAHDHHHDEANTASGLEQTKALLTYMLQHNEHHAEELAGLMDALPEDAREKLSLAIGTYEAANVQLQEVLDVLK